MWPQCGVCSVRLHRCGERPQRALARGSQPDDALQLGNRGAAQISLRGTFALLTRVKAAAYIRGSRCAVRLGVLARLRSSSLNASSYADPASDLGRKHGVSTALRASGGWDHPVPGCLTGESEERETWTAESLRAVRLGSGQPGDWRRPDETSAVHVSGQHCCREAAGHAREQSPARLSAHAQEWDLVKRSDQPGKVLIQLESLILAQSERWRQA
jgi:hypothetical protein